MLAELFQGNRMNRSQILKEVIELLYKIPKGKVTTYKIIGDALGIRAYRLIGSILGDNNTSAPCYRVVMSSGEVGGFKHSKNNQEKINLLKQEGVEVKNGRVDLKKYLFRFN